jgi:ketosteroid isomerase-like protein
MPEENLDLVRSIFAAWERGDYSSAEWADPEMEFVVVDGPNPGSWIGLTALADAVRERASAWEGLRTVADELQELDDERVLVLDHAAGRGKRSGLELGQMQTQGAHLFYVRDGKVTRLVTYANRNRALAELGLAPEGR